MSKNNLNVLVVSAGGLTGTFLIKHLKALSLEGISLNIIAADCSINNYSYYTVNKFYKTSLVSSPDFKKEIIQIIENDKIDIIFPVTSYDVPFFAMNKSSFESMGVKILVSDAQTIETLHDKQLMYSLMKKLGIKVPSVYSDEVLFPAIIKPCRGSGSKGTYKLNDSFDYDYWIRAFDRDNCIITEFITGEEYTVDCLFNDNGYPVGYNTRKRIKTIGGGAVITENKEKAGVSKIIEILAKNMVLKGPVNFQFIEDVNGVQYLTDFNPRFASGGLPLTVASGFDIPSDIIRILIGQKPIGYKDKESMIGLRMYRYFDEFFVRS